jgi:NAD(P)-dependent dehydrogenase (short-subunit alcohol dehydrogenase family)
VLTTGIAGQRPQKGWLIAASVCGTIEALTRALAVELAPIRVNAVSPGVDRTNLWQTMSASERNVYTRAWGTVSLLAESPKLPRSRKPIYS